MNSEISLLSDQQIISVISYGRKYIEKFVLSENEVFRIIAEMMKQKFSFKINPVTHSVTHDELEFVNCDYFPYIPRTPYAYTNNNDIVVIIEEDNPLKKVLSEIDEILEKYTKRIQPLKKYYPILRFRSKTNCMGIEVFRYFISIKVQDTTPFEKKGKVSFKLKIRNLYLGLIQNLIMYTRSVSDITIIRPPPKITRSILFDLKEMAELDEMFI